MKKYMVTLIEGDTFILTENLKTQSEEYKPDLV